jgi:HAD superfamily hydrolase (TIGR01509 family)
MPKTALLFGSIGSVVETSDIQRRAYNEALQEAGLDWVWDRDTYAELLTQSGGKERLAMLAAATGAQLSDEQIERIHARKTEIACEELVRTRVSLRPGVADLIKLGKERGMKLAFVTTTYRPNVDAIFEAAADTLAPADFDYIVARTDVKRGKPAPDAYLLALKQLGIAPTDALAIEDTANSVMAAKRAGITVIATPGELSAGQDFWQADAVVDALSIAGAIDKRVLALLN